MPKTSISDVERVLRSQIGYVEDRSGQSKYGAWLGLYGNVPWCMMFLSWGFYQAFHANGETSPLEGQQFAKGPAHSSVPMTMARAGINGFKWLDNPVKGAFAIYNWNGWNTPTDHIGWVSDPGDGRTKFKAIEGNTSSANQSDGGHVEEKWRSNVSGYTQGFALPVYGTGSGIVVPSQSRMLTLATPDMQGDDVRELQTLLKRKGFAKVPDLTRYGWKVVWLNYRPGSDLVVDGDYGHNTHACVLAFQKTNGLEPDGVVGPQTLAKLRA